MKHSAVFAGILAVVAALPAYAQEHGVNRRMYTFLDDDVTIEVSAESGGTLQVIRGEAGVLEVSARAPGGFTAFALGGRNDNTLRLTAAGGERADFVVVVPERTYLRVRLPNRKQGELGSRRPGATYTWSAPSAVSTVSRNAPPTPARSTMAHSSATAPRVLNVPNLNSARSITVRVEPGPFMVGGNEWMSVERGSSTNVEIRTGSQAADLEIVVPIETRDFTMKLGGRTALVIRDSQVTSYCQSVTEQEFAGGARRFTYSPEMGRLSCR